MRFAMLIALAIPSVAYADVSFEVADHGDTVEVIAHNVEAKNTVVFPVRSRLSVQINGNPVATRTASADATVLFAEFDGHSFSVKTRLGYPEVKDLAPLAHAEQIGADLHLTFPRHALTVAKETPKAPVVTATPASATPAIPAPAATPVVGSATPALHTPPKSPSITPASAGPAPAPAAVAATPVLPTPPPASTPVRNASTPEGHTPIPTEHVNNLGSPSLYGTGALITLLACGYLMKRKKKVTTIEGSIDVVAQRSLGNKAKVMWLSAGGRELLVAVTQQQVRMLGAWPKSDREGLPRAATLGRDNFKQQLETAAAEPELAPPPIQSSAVSGILKLRAKTSAPVPMVNEDVATDDMEADLEWAKEILTASRASGGLR